MAAPPSKKLKRDSDEVKDGNDLSEEVKDANYLSEEVKDANYLSEEVKDANYLSEEVKDANYLSEEEYFMAVAFLTAKRSRDPVSQVGACIVKSNRHIVSVGYNEMPNGCSDKDLSWQKRKKNPSHCKKLYVCHAELNAITNKISADVSLCSIYVTRFPCNDCAKIIIRSGINEVVYYSDMDAHQTVNAKKMLKKSNVEYRRYEGDMKRFEISFQEAITEELFQSIKQQYFPKTLTDNEKKLDDSTPRVSGEYLESKEYFMSLAVLSAQRSRCPNLGARNGACIVDKHERIVGIGYNDIPTCWDDTLMPPDTDNNAFYAAILNEESNDGSDDESADESDDEPADEFDDEPTIKSDPLEDWSWYECDASINAIMNKNMADMSECVLYCTHHPNSLCARLIIQSGLREVRYLKKTYDEAAKTLFSAAGIKTVDYSSECKQKVFETINTNFK